jgi:S-(hydroxymethyl)glutathione dehydrogenase/alcohol dehydrogenase
MKTRAAVLMSAPGEFETVEVDLDGPGTGELMVKMVAAGLCHSDDHLATGDIPVGVYPFCGGHEGSGVVIEVGPDTPGFQVGDHVVFAFVPACGRCRWCTQGRQNLCDLGANMLNGSRFDDPTSFRMSLDGRPVGQNSGVSTFSEFTTVSVDSAVKVRDDVPLEPLSLLGCAFGTGWGSSVHAANARPGETLIIMGIGGIGSCAVQGAVAAGAAHVIAVDPVEFKRQAGLDFGATHAVASIDEATELARSVTNGQGADATIVTVGVTTGEHVGQAFASIRKGGTVVVTGAGSATVSQVPLNLLELAMFEKRITGALYGHSSPLGAIPEFVDLYAAGRIQLDELMTTTYKLDEVAQGYRDMHAGKNIRGMIAFDA